MKFDTKTKILIAVSTVAVILFGIITFFAIQYFSPPPVYLGTYDEEAQLDRERENRLLPTISTAHFDCSLPTELRSSVHRDVNLTILATDISAAEKSIVDIFKKYPGAADGISSSNYSYSSSIDQRNDSSINFNGRVPAASADAIVRDIEKLQKPTLILSAKSANSIPARDVVSSCNTSLIYTQGLAIKEEAYLNQLQWGELDAYSINEITQQLSDTRSQFANDINNSYSHSNVKKSIEQVNMTISINILNG